MTKVKSASTSSPYPLSPITHRFSSPTFFLLIFTLDEFENESEVKFPITNSSPDPFVLLLIIPDVFENEGDDCQTCCVGRKRSHESRHQPGEENPEPFGLVRVGDAMANVLVEGSYSGGVGLEARLHHVDGVSHYPRCASGQTARQEEVG